ncbi:MAG: cytochrome c [Opitutus sp.]
MKYAKHIALGSAVIAAAAFALAAPVAENWASHCAKCHGADGTGQTKIGKKLKLKDYSKAEVQAAMSDEEIIKSTADGVTVDGKEKMKGFKSELSEAEIKEFVAYIRKFKS